ncbi:FecCD family ABC transporter permease [Brevibacillus laterosporus]|uniref:FecCD family ABC transporter permease n=1 Tax=Brevibacillus laterosporus TaxID=1465 RepID=UPI0013CEC75B|nr:iron ABC transporter permease [Brevibacillus laterosporus]
MMQSILYRRAPLIMGLLVAMIVTVILISLNSGSIPISPLEVWETFLNGGTRQQETVLFQFRMPRLVIALLIGSGLAVSGVILQGLSRNALADPGILGINAGAGLAVVLFMYFAFETKDIKNVLSVMMIPLVALIGAGVTSLLIFMLAWKRGITPIRLILVGIAVSAGIGAINTVVSLKLAFANFMYATVWLAGSLWGTSWTFVIAILPWILILVPYAIWKARYLNVLNLGDELATGVGMRVERERGKLIFVSAGLAGACVAAGGGIGFIGLVAPHIARKLVGPKHQFLIPTATLVGALLLLLADLVARNILTRTEVPVGIVISVLGAPYFIYLLMKTKT